MRKCLLLLSLLCFSVAAFAQIDGADECSTAISLGIAPTCPNTTVYTNENSTASVLPFDNTPTCFSTIPDNDVWFTFTTPADGSIVDFTLQLFSFVDNGNGIQNPQIAVYRIDGSCDELAEYDCLSTPDGTSNTSFDLVGLTPGEIYYLRINDYSATGTPNSGEFTLCVSEFVPFFNLCETDASSSCFGTLFDSGGPDGDYSANEDCSFTICPSEFNECIAFDLVNYNLENNFDNLIFYAGDNTSAPVISTISGSGNGNPFEIEGGSDCITIQMTSDGSGQQEGFELTWQCSSLECNSSEDDITVIPNLPFDSDNLTTCDNSATFQGTACGVQDFMAGPEAIFTYTTEGGIEECYSIQITGAAVGTGVLVLDGPPSDPASVCVGTAATGNLGSVNFSAAGTYYIIVANGDGCTEFDINIQPSSCVLDPSLEAALCNPLNGCQNEDGLPSIFSFNTDFFVDVEIVNGVNDGCWGGIGAGNFYWFTIQAAADGPFGFTFQSADPAEASDIDFNVWGPFTNDQVCGSPTEVIDIIGSTQPYASSYAGGTEPTGLIDIHPTTGTVQDEFYDCDGVGASGNDDFVSSIPTTEGEVYVVLVNDWGGQILSGQVQVDFQSTGPGVLDPIDQLIEIDVEAPEVCQGVSVQLEVETASNNILWSPSESLSCSDCPNPIATPTETTEYVVTIDGVCVDAIGTATVNVYNADAGPDQSVCLGEEIEIVGGQFFAQGTYLWEGEAGTISDATSPSPTITAVAPGVYTYTVTLTTVGCTITDEMILTVLPTDAAVYEVSDDLEICNGETVSIGGFDAGSTNFSWTSDPIGFTSTEANPVVTPTETTVYYLEASNLVSGCLFPSIDSVKVTVFEPFTLNANPDIAVCQGDTVVLSTLEPEDDVTYSWSPATGIVGGDTTIPNVSAVPQTTTTYTLSAFRGACEEEISTTVTVNEISIEIDQPTEAQEICIGEQVQIEATATPAGIEVNWSPTAGLSPTTGTSLTATPTEPTLYIATVELPGCIRMDSLFIQVDSLPMDMSILPQDTTICEGEIVILQSPIYEPADFPNMTHLWSPVDDATFETEDTLYNMVTSVTDTTIFIRETINGACSQTDMTTVNVQEVVELTITPVDPFICAGDTVQLLVTSEDPTITEFEWNDEASGLSCYDCPNPLATPNNSIQYEVKVVLEDGLEGCTPTATVDITVAVEPNAPKDEAHCEPELIGVNHLGDMNPAYTYSWTTEAGFSSSEVNPSFNLVENTEFTYSIANGDCPPITGTITHSIADQESVMITGDSELCSGETAVLTAETTTSGTENSQLTWSTGENSNSIDVNQTGLYTVTYQPDTLGCAQVSFDSEFQVTFFQFPVIDSTTRDNTMDCVFEGQSFDLFVASDAATIAWTDQEGNALGNTPTITTTAPDLIEGTETEETVEWSYTYVAANEIGCEVTDSIKICVKNALFNIPNVFTPNGDDINSTFAPIAGETIIISTFEVYNRWGQKVFDAAESGLDAWDGTFNEKPAPADVYAFVVRYTDGVAGELTKRGDVTLVR